MFISPLNAELNPISNLLGLLRSHHILHVSRVSKGQYINKHNKVLSCLTDTSLYIYIAVTCTDALKRANYCHPL